MTLEIAICEDEKDFAEKLSKLLINELNDYSDKYVVKKFSNAFDLLEYYKEKTVDIVLSDVDMPEIGGFEMREKLRYICPKAYVIFITAHTELAYHLFDHNSYGFVHKGDLRRFRRVLMQYIDKVKLQKLRDIQIQSDSKETVDIDLHKDMYITHERNYVLVHDESEKTRSFRATLKSVYAQIKDYYFVWVQSGCIVNCRFIDKFTSREVILLNGKKIQLTRDTKKRQEAKDLHAEYVRRN